MDDAALEALLKRYRPVAPVAGLRARLLARPPQLWPWLAAAALLAVLAVGASWRASSILLDVRVASWQDVEGQATRALGDVLGGDDRARAWAETVVAHQRFLRDAVEPQATSGREDR